MVAKASKRLQLEDGLINVFHFRCRSTQLGYTNFTYLFPCGGEVTEHAHSFSLTLGQAPPRRVRRHYPRTTPLEPIHRNNSQIQVGCRRTINAVSRLPSIPNPHVRIRNGHRPHRSNALVAGRSLTVQHIAGQREAPIS